MPGHWRSSAAFADQRRPAPVPRGPSTPRRPERRPPVVADLRRPLLPGRRLARRGLPRRHRGLLLAAHLRGHRRPPGPVRAPPRRRGHLQPADRPHGEAQHHRRVPALGLPRPRLEPRRDLAPGPRRARPGPVRIAGLRVLCREATVERAAWSAAGHPRQRRWPAPSPCSPPSVPSTTASTSPSPTARTRWSGPSRSTSRPCGGPAPSATQPSTTLSVRGCVHDDGRDGGTAATSAVSDERRLRTGLRQVRMRHWVASVNGERLFLKGANQGPTRMALAEATRRRAGARRRPRPGRRSRPAAGARPHQPPRALRRGRRRGCSCGRTSPPVGLRPRRRASRPSARPAAAVDAPRPPPVHRHLVRPQRAAGHRDRPGDVERPAGPAPHGLRPCRARSCPPGTRRCSTAP